MTGGMVLRVNFSWIRIMAAKDYVLLRWSDILP